ncbi:MAG TPA: hypothetical protein VEA39_04465 [Methylophilaceae bacterium]|nr:hypothetical protein [Methylophilaceae bacterium]
MQATLLASAVRAATNSTPDQEGDQFDGIHVIVDVTAVPGTDTVTPSIQGRDPVSGKYYDLLVGSAISAVGTVVLKVGQGIAAAANLAAADIVPSSWRVVLTHSAGTNFTYSVGLNGKKAFK